MAFDIFSSFDMGLYGSSNMGFSFVFWGVSISCVFIFMCSYWVSMVRLSSFFFMVVGIIGGSGNNIGMKGLDSLMSSLFIMIMTVNMMGMFPYVYSVSSHLLFTLSLGVPLWVGPIISSLLKVPEDYMGQLLPGGAPAWLNPFLVCVESISVCIRPLTLSFRLTANMTAGHVVMGLISIYGSVSIFGGMFLTIFVILIQAGYVIFEFCICFIQSYIFCLLGGLYASEHPSL